MNQNKDPICPQCGCRLRRRKPKYMVINGEVVPWDDLEFVLFWVCPCCFYVKWSTRGVSLKGVQPTPPSTLQRLH